MALKVGFQSTGDCKLCDEQHSQHLQLTMMRSLPTAAVPLGTRDVARPRLAMCSAASRCSPLQVCLAGMVHWWLSAVAGRLPAGPEGEQAPPEASYPF